MKLISNLLGTLSLLLIALCSHAESDSTDTLDPVVITATREETKESQVASTTTVITAEEIKARRINSVAEILRVVPGLDVLSSGGPGHMTSVFTRGANSNQTLVLIDNIMMNDPGSADGAFDFANLQVDNIERIEVLRGAASAIWGADAMGGVIHIITKHGSGKPQFTGLAEGGNYATWKVGGGVSGSEGNFNYTLNASHFSNVGVSSAAASMGNSERDPYQNTTVQARTGYQITPDLDLDWTLRYNNGQVGLDNCGGPGCDNPYYWQNTNEIYTRGQARLFLLDRRWEQRFGVNFSQTNRNTWYSNQDAAIAIPSTYASPANNQGQQIKVEWIHFLQLTENDTLTAGIDGKFNSMNSALQAFNGYPEYFSEGTMSNGGYYIQNNLTWLDRFNTNASGRLDNNSVFGNHLTWRVNQVIGIPEIGNRIKANVGTAFRAPSLCELNPTCGGNPNLSPETSLDWDAGLEQEFDEGRIKLGSLYFHNHFNNLIQYNPNAPNDFYPGYGNIINIQSAISEGIESFIEYKPIEAIQIRMNYTFDQTQGLYDTTNGVQTNNPLLLRPKNKGNFDLDYRFLEKATTHLNILAFGSRSSFDNTNSVVQVAGYVLVNLSANYELNDQVTLFARMDNLLNKQYQQVWGYGTMGFTGIGGLNLKL